MPADCGIEEESLGDGVQALEQSLAVGFGDLKLESRLRSRTASTGSVERYGLAREIDRDFRFSRLGSAGLGEGLPVPFIQLNDEKPVVKRVGLEDVGEAFSFTWGDNSPVARLHHRPDGVFAAGPAAEVMAHDEYGGALDRRVVERKIRLERPVPFGLMGLGGAARHVSLVGKKQWAEAHPLDSLEVAGGDDQVGVHVAPVQDGQPAPMRDEWFHLVLCPLSFVRFACIIGHGLVNWHGSIAGNTSGMLARSARVYPEPSLALRASMAARTSTQSVIQTTARLNQAGKLLVRCLLCVVRCPPFVVSGVICYQGSVITP